MVGLPQLRRVRWAVRATLALGVIASTIANVLHAQDNLISQTIAAWPPIALLLTIELISRIPTHRRSLAIVRLATTAIIAGIAAWVSYWHMVGVIARYGETGAGPYLIPLTVDGLVVVASVCLVELAGRIRAASRTEAQQVEAADAKRAVTPARRVDVEQSPGRPPRRRTPAAMPSTGNFAEVREQATDGVTTTGPATSATPARLNGSSLLSTVGTPASRSARGIGRGIKEVKVPQTPEACIRWAACWVAMCRDGLNTGPIRLSFEAEVKQRYGWGVKQLRDVRNAATSGQLRAQAVRLGVQLPADYRDDAGDSGSKVMSRPDQPILLG